MSKRGLGKGLDALLATSSMAREKQQTASHSQAMSTDGELIELSITSLKPGIYQPRKDMSSEALEELALSIQSQGIINLSWLGRLSLVVLRSSRVSAVGVPLSRRV